MVDDKIVETNEDEVVETVEDTPEVVVEVDGKEIEKVADKQQKSYTQIRAERAAEKARKEFLEELGVADIEEAKQRMQDGSAALKLATTIKADLEQEQLAKVNAAKSQQLRELFKDTFDPEVLVQLTNLEEIELNADGTLKDSESIINTAKEQRPRFFGQTVTTADTVVTKTGKIAPTDSAQAAYEAGDYQKAVKEHLKTLFK